MMNSEDEKINSHLQHINLIQSLNVAKLDDDHINFIEDLILKDLNSICIQNIYHMILPLALSWAEYDSPVKLKLLSCKILGESISNIDDTLVLQRDILPITQYLLQDTQPEVRSSVCRQLPSLLCKVDQLSENLLLTSLLDAAQDNSAQVRCAVLDVLIDSEPYIFKE
ncbi:serine/threonine-protein phosphatase 4 regulatory subunit 4-like [Diaphorina citri]|uniref:Serine/threonine-protein phosphatase 4 regulatory subunit 4-like n=1 Tax=Diaphorina citri TaxID=121845 RepID=A0A1S3CTI6_DIACI|nr:serine/threonine-protein phosphatase 4 regulatory subunit 4-like [Diaphorina citri]